MDLLLSIAACSKLFSEEYKYSHMQKELQQKLTDKVLKRLEAFEKLAASNGAPEGWLYGKVTGLIGHFRIFMIHVIGYQPYNQFLL